MISNFVLRISHEVDVSHLQRLGVDRFRLGGKSEIRNPKSEKKVNLQSSICTTCILQLSY